MSGSFPPTGLQIIRVARERQTYPSSFFFFWVLYIHVGFLELVELQPILANFLKVKNLASSKSYLILKRERKREREKRMNEREAEEKEIYHGAKDIVYIVILMCVKITRMEFTLKETRFF